MFKDSIDFKTFKAIVGRYGADYADGGLSDTVLLKYINNHVKGKAHIFELFGGKLKVEKELDVSISNSEAHNIKCELSRSISSISSKNIIASSFIETISLDEFFSNVLKRDIYFLDVAMTKGMKVSKALGRLVPKELVDKVQTEHSMAYQKLFAKGKVVLSIDPCDYVTMSSNASGWRSCHRLDGGEYRTGPLAYLNDSSSVICYVESSTPCKFRRNATEYTHSNKVWRQIALVSPELEYVMQERQYPNSNTLNETAVSEMFTELLSEYNNKPYVFKTTSSDLLTQLHRDYATEEDECALYYNDIIHEMFSRGNVCMEMGASATKLASIDESQKPLKGEVVYCLECGDTIYDTESLYCEDCRSDYDDDDSDW